MPRTGYQLLSRNLDKIGLVRLIVTQTHLWKQQQQQQREVFGNGNLFGCNGFALIKRGARAISGNEANTATRSVMY